MQQEGANYFINQSKEDNKEENPIKNFGKQIQNIFNEIDECFNKFKDYDTAMKINFENDIKNKIKSEIDKIMK